MSDGPTGGDVRDSLIVALDVAHVGEAEALIDTLGQRVGFYKIGLELAYGGGLDLAERLIAGGKKVFLDLKLHDIPATVERAASQVSRLGATFLTVHAFPQTMVAAKAGVAGSGTGILGVTVMTSYDDGDLSDAGYAVSVRELVARRADQAVSIGIDGLILAAEDIAAMRRRVGRKLTLVSPGIRPEGAAKGDQKRTMTPGAAIKAGADHLVVGRPITRAADPQGAAEAILAEMAAGRAG